MKKQPQNRNRMQPEGDRVSATAEHDNRFFPPRVKA